MVRERGGESVTGREGGGGGGRGEKEREGERERERVYLLLDSLTSQQRTKSGIKTERLTERALELNVRYFGTSFWV